jgi:hypothetical protein
MGKNLDQIIAEARDGYKFGVTIVTNQNNGIASYAVGSLIYHAGALSGPFFRPARLSTTGGVPLDFYFSDRVDSFGEPPQPQRFSAKADRIDKLGVSISLHSGPRVVRFTFHSWGGATVGVAVESMGNLLVGLGPPLGDSPHAVYLIAFTGLIED